MKEVRAGLYSFRSPYHKRKLLPFLLHPDGLVETVEYKGWTRTSVRCRYDNPQEAIEACRMKFELPTEDIGNVWSHSKRHNELLCLL